MEPNGAKFAGAVHTAGNRKGERCSISFLPAIGYHRAMFRDLPVVARELKAEPEVLERIYQASRLGLRGDSLALYAGLLPVEFRRLKTMDPMADLAEMKGRADAEGMLAGTLMAAAEGGDAKVALEVLKHKHDWVAKQQVQVDVAQQISVTAALEAAQARLTRGLAVEIEDAVEVTRPLARALPAERT